MSCADRPDIPGQRAVCVGVIVAWPICEVYSGQKKTPVFDLIVAQSPAFAVPSNVEANGCVP